jgi:hypothetical protein
MLGFCSAGIAVIVVSLPRYVPRLCECHYVICVLEFVTYCVTYSLVVKSYSISHLRIISEELYSIIFYQSQRDGSCGRHPAREDAGISGRTEDQQVRDDSLPCRVSGLS